jgi:4-hydroxy-tetrahydrodipicolinate synthase
VHSISHFSHCDPPYKLALKRGSTVALITPFTETGAVDYAGLKKLLEYHLESGTDNLCILGTTGEASVLTKDERTKVLQMAVDTVKGTMPILVGTGAIDPTSVKEMTQHALDIGCDAALIVTPYYVKPPQRALVTHMTTMANVGLPVVIYNVPGRTGVDFQDDYILEAAAQHENIVGLKDATGDLSRIDSMMEKLGKDRIFFLYSGDDATTVDFVLKGGDGCISVTANIAAKAMHNIVMAALDGDADKARELNEPLESLHKDLFCEANPMPAKWAAKRIGLLDQSYCRPPLCDFDVTALGGTVEGALKRAGLL